MNLKRYYVFIKKETGLIFYCTTFAYNSSEAVVKEFNEKYLKNMYGNGILFATFKDNPKCVTRFSKSF